MKKLLKVYDKGREGKDQDEDVFVETCKYIAVERELMDSLVVWGKAVVEVRKVYIEHEQKLND